MEKLELPFNVTEMTLEEKQIFAEKLSQGSIKLSLEVRDNERNLLGFQPVLSLDYMDRIVKRLLINFTYLNNKLINCKRSEKKKILLDIKELKDKIDSIYKHKCYFIASPDDIGYEIEKLESYQKDEMLLSFESKNSKTY